MAAAEDESMVSGDTVSEMPSSSSEGDEESEDEGTPQAMGPVAASLSVRSAHGANFSQQWKNAARSPTRPGALAHTVRPFLSLPRELRDQIYRELYVHDDAIAIRQPKFHMPVRAHPSVPLALTRTNQQIYREAMEIFISENSFVLDLNILTAIDFLAAMPTALAVHFNSMTLGKGIMSGYVRYELGMFDSSRLRSDLVKRLVYDFNLKSISIEVPDEHNPNAQNNGNGAGGTVAGAGNANPNTWFQFPSFHPRHDYSWSLMRELIDVLLESGFQTLRLVYATPFHHDIVNDPKSLLKLYAVSRILYMDDEFEVETQVKRIEMARLAGRRDEFEDKKAVEKYVRSRRSMRKFEVGKASLRPWESGSAVMIRRLGGKGDKGEEKMWDVKELMDMPGAIESLNVDL